MEITSINTVWMRDHICRANINNIFPLIEPLLCIISSFSYTPTHHNISSSRSTIKKSVWASLDSKPSVISQQLLDKGMKEKINLNHTSAH